MLFCTDIAARGLDFPSIDWVVQFDCPEDSDTYIHRVGRAGRFRAKGNRLLFLLFFKCADNRSRMILSSFQICKKLLSHLSVKLLREVLRADVRFDLLVNSRFLRNPCQQKAL